MPRRKQAHPLRYLSPRVDTPRYSPVNMRSMPTWIPYLTSGTGEHWIPEPRVRMATMHMRDDDTGKKRQRAACTPTAIFANVDSMHACSYPRSVV